MPTSSAGPHTSMSLAVLVALLAVACGDGAAQSRFERLLEDAERRYAKPREAGRLPPELAECSGLAASRRSPGIFWAHNDSGHGARLFALKLDGTLVAQVELIGAQAKDWEAIAIGPGSPAPEKPWITIADTGNNERQRADLALLRFPEPDLAGLAPPAQIEERAAERVAIRYASGAHDCEAIAVHPTRGEIFLFTKDILVATVFRIAAPARGQTDAVAEKVSVLPLPLVTDGSFDPDGRHVLLRTYVALHEFAVDPDHPFSSQSPAKELLRLRHLEPQGEAACYAADGAIVTTSEGEGAVLHKFDRRSGGR